MSTKPAKKNENKYVPKASEVISRTGLETSSRELKFVGQLAGGKGIDSKIVHIWKRDAQGKKKDALADGDGGEGEDDEEFQGFDLEDFYTNAGS